MLFFNELRYSKKEKKENDSAFHNALISKSFILSKKIKKKYVGKNGFEHNNLAIFELKLYWVPQSFLGGST